MLYNPCSMDILFPHIILASGSPRRLEILRAHGIEPKVVLPDVDEDGLLASCAGSLSPEALVCHLALSKARAVYGRIGSNSCDQAGTASHEQGRAASPKEVRAASREEIKNALRESPEETDGIILAADTIVLKEDGGILGKPIDHDDAVWMLRTLCDAAHRVITGMACIDTVTGREASLADSTTVRFGSYTLCEIEVYLLTEPPFDKAGGYAIQGMWGQHVESIDGDLENVIGLPYYRLKELLKEVIERSGDR